MVRCTGARIPWVGFSRLSSKNEQSCQDNLQNLVKDLFLVQLELARWTDVWTRRKRQLINYETQAPRIVMLVCLPINSVLWMSRLNSALRGARSHQQKKACQKVKLENGLYRRQSVIQSVRIIHQYQSKILNPNNTSYYHIACRSAHIISYTHSFISTI